MLNSLRSRIAKWIAPAKPKKVQAGYDAAASGIDDDHWAWADSLNANALNSTEVRKTLREKARYEEQNNCYCGNLVDKLSKDMVGTVPRLQLSIPGASAEAIRTIERRFKLWANSINLGEKLRLLDMAAIRDGEGFATLAQNPALEGVQLDLKLFETDQVRSPFINYIDLNQFDGGRIDEFGNVVEWDFLLAHPGSNLWIAAFVKTKPVPAAQVIQWFKPRRAGQLRGVPEITSALTLYGYLRRYTLATVTAAETAASIAGVLETDMMPDNSGPTQAMDMEQIPMPRGTMLTVPAGYKAKGFDASQPTTNYPQFKGELLTETGACVGAPRNVATGSSAEYNYSSARLDHGIYQHGIRVRRHDFCRKVLDRIVRAWLDEAALIPGMIPDGLPLRFDWSWEWFFDGFPSLDPVKEANADDIRLRNGTTNLAEIYAEYGQDWREQLQQRAIEIEYAKSLGIFEAITGGAPPAIPVDLSTETGVVTNA
jgi:capsid protein